MSVKILILLMSRYDDTVHSKSREFFAFTNVIRIPCFSFVHDFACFSIWQGSGRLHECLIFGLSEHQHI